MLLNLDLIYLYANILFKCVTIRYLDKEYNKHIKM